MQIVNPATEVVEGIEETSLSEINPRITAAREAQVHWGLKSVGERACILNGLVENFHQHSEDLVAAIMLDMGKPRRKSIFELKITTDLVRHTAAHAEEWLAQDFVAGSTILHQPLGVAAVISPWNFPLYISCTAILPALMAGNEPVPVVWTVFRRS
jgi:acyl-CoA reductase-like NAD-dependent aldehyde dehydrogenase